jgi:hypothetical protein
MTPNEKATLVIAIEIIAKHGPQAVIELRATAFRGEIDAGQLDEAVGHLKALVLPDEA